MKNFSRVFYFLTVISFFAFSNLLRAEKIKPFVLTDEAISNDQLVHTAGDRVVYIQYDEESSRLYSVKLDGSDKKYLSGVMLPDENPEDDEEPGEVEEKKMLVLAQNQEHFLVNKEGNEHFVYFQARPNRQEYSYYLYKVNTNGSAYPTRLVELPEPGNKILSRADKKVFYLTRENNHSFYDLGANELNKIEVEAYGASNSKISSDFRYLVYVKSVINNGQKFELHAYDTNTKSDILIPIALEGPEVKIDITADSSKIIVNRYQSGRSTLEAISMNGSGLSRFFPHENDTQNYNIEFFRAVKGTRGSGDKGVVLFLSRSPNGSNEDLKKYDLNDKIVTPVKIDQLVGEFVSHLRLTPDSKTILYRKTASGQKSRNYSYNFLNSTANPEFIFASDYQVSEISEDSSSLVYVNNSEVEGERNSIVLATLNGLTSTNLSSNFENGWISASERITSIKLAETHYVLTVADVQPGEATEYSIRSFKR